MADPEAVKRAKALKNQPVAKLGKAIAEAPVTAAKVATNAEKQLEIGADKVKAMGKTAADKISNGLRSMVH